MDEDKNDMLADNFGAMFLKIRASAAGCVRYCNFVLAIVNTKCPAPQPVGGSIRFHELGPKPKIPYCTAGMLKKIKLLISS